MASYRRSRENDFFKSWEKALQSNYSIVIQHWHTFVNVLDTNLRLIYQRRKFVDQVKLLKKWKHKGNESMCQKGIF